MASITQAVGKRATKDVDFNGIKVTISKLTVAEVMEIQKASDVSADDQNSGLAVLRQIINSSVEGGKDLSDDDFNGFPMDELTKLSNAIMNFSGIGESGKGK
jgi:hypothetical protein